MPHKARRSQFGKWLKSQRETASLTQLDLAKLLSYDNPQIISNIERGFSALPSKRVSDFATHLQCSTLEMEIRRMWASCKDENSAQALEQILNYLPILEHVHRENLETHVVLTAISQLRVASSTSSI